MSDPLETICNLTGCTLEEAEKTYEETKDIVEAVDKLLEKASSKAEMYIQSKRVKKQVTFEEDIIKPVRTLLKTFDEKMSTSLRQHGHEGQVEKLNHHEEMVLQNNCSQECQIPSLESGVERQETAYQSLSEYFSCLQLSDQTSPSSDRGLTLLNQGQETALSQMVERIPV